MAITLNGAGGFLYADCRDEEVLLEGPAGASKTVPAMKKLVDACYQYPGSRHLLCRATRKSMTDSTLPTLESIIGQNHPEVLRVSPEQRHSYRLNGSEIVCGGMDEPSKTFGTAWGLIVVEEAIEIELGDWELLARSSRDPRLLRAGERPSFPYHQRICVTNPGHQSHWLNQRATPCPDIYRTINTIDDLARLHAFNEGPQSGIMRRLVAVHQDNPAFFNVDTWSWTEAGAKYMKALGSMSGSRLKNMKKGVWAAPSGVVFPQWDEDVHLVEDFEPPASWAQVVALDPGWGRCGIDWIAISPDGGLYVYDCIEEGGKTIAQHCEEIQRRNEANGRNILRYFGDPNEMFSTRAQGPSCADQARKAGLRFVPWPPDRGKAFDAGVDAVRTCLTTEPGGGLYLRVCRRCKGLRDNFSSWSMKKNASGEQVEGADKYENANDHCLDPLRGVVQSQFLQTQHRRANK